MVAFLHRVFSNKRPLKSPDTILMRASSQDFAHAPGFVRSVCGFVLLRAAKPRIAGRPVG